MKRFSTTNDFINNHVRSGGFPAGEVVEMLGYNSAGDQGAALWRSTGLTIASSQTVIDTNDIKISDASGNEFELVHIGIIDLNALGGTSGAYVTIATNAGLTWSQSFTSIPSNATLNYDTTSDMVNAAGLAAGDVVETAEFSTGNGGGGVYDVVLTSSVTPNGYDIIQGVADTTISFVWRKHSMPSVSELGSIGSSNGDETAIWQRFIALGIRAVTVPYVAAGYTISGLTSNNTMFIFEDASPLNGTDTYEDLGMVFDTTYFGGVPMAETMRDGRIGIVCGTIRQNGNKSVTSITRSGAVATVTQTAHGYSNGDLVYIRGANETEYNVSGEAITVTGDDTYTYAVSGTPATPATGTITASVPANWDFINDSAHEPVGVDLTNPPTASTSSITINFNKTYSEVIGMVVCPDETLANAHNLTLGPSVGLSSINIKGAMTIDGATHIHYDGASWVTSSGAGQDLNPQITFTPNGRVEIDHDYCPGIKSQATAFSQNGAIGVVPYIPVIRAISATKTQLNFIVPSTGAFAADSTANTNYSFHWTKSYSEGVVFDGTSDSFDGLSLWQGNIWFFGIFKL